MDVRLEKRGWTRKGGELKNVDILKELDHALQQHRVTFEWVKGHAGEAGNEHVDELLNQAMDRLKLVNQLLIKIDLLGATEYPNAPMYLNQLHTPHTAQEIPATPLSPTKPTT